MTAFIDALRDRSVAGLVLLLVAALAIVIAAIARRRDRAATGALPLSMALLCSLAAILVLTLTPGGGPNEWELVPLVHIIRGHPRQYRVDVLMNVVANAFLFVPLGAALGMLGVRFRTAVVLALGLSTAIEATQLLVPGRTTSTDDVLLNTLGAACGHMLVRAWRRRALDAASGASSVQR